MGGNRLKLNEGREIRVCHVFKTFFPDTNGGLERVIAEICNQTSKTGVRNTVVTLSDTCNSRRTIEYRGIQVVQFPVSLDIASSPISVSLFRQFADIVADADLLHYHFPWPFIDLVHLLKGKDKPSIVTYHSDIIKHRFLNFFYKPFMIRFLDSMSRIIPTSDNYLESSEDLQRYKEKSTVIPIGVDESSYPPVLEEKRKFWRDKLGSDFFLFVGVLRQYKGLHVLLEAAKGISQKIVIVGSGPTEKALRREISLQKIENVVLTGFLEEEEKVALLSLARALVFPSHQRAEAFGVSLVEGAMFGKPLISTELGTGTSYVNKADVTGLVVPANDALALREAITKIASDDNLAQKMGRAARERYESLFTPEKMGGKYLSLYQSVLMEKKA